RYSSSTGQHSVRDTAALLDSTLERAAVKSAIRLAVSDAHTIRFFAPNSIRKRKMNRICYDIAAIVGFPITGKRLDSNGAYGPPTELTAFKQTETNNNQCNGNSLLNWTSSTYRLLNYFQAKVPALSQI
ncbi:unnamed protein product, partial [Ceratitis capitata]